MPFILTSLRSSFSTVQAIFTCKHTFSSRPLLHSIFIRFPFPPQLPRPDRLNPHQTAKLQHCDGVLLLVSLSAAVVVVLSPPMILLYPQKPSLFARSAFKCVARVCGCVCLFVCEEKAKRRALNVRDSFLAVSSSSPLDFGR